jgi:hypothetical protein
MKWPHDLGTWGFVLSIVTLILMYPVGLLINLTSPAIANWLSTWSKNALQKRIDKLEMELAQLEKTPGFDEFQDRALWGVTSIKINVLGCSNTVVIAVFLGIRSIANVQSPVFKEFYYMCYLILAMNIITMLVARYQRAFRYTGSPRVREALRKSILELKRIQARQV